MLEDPRILGNEIYYVVIGTGRSSHNEGVGSDETLPRTCDTRKGIEGDAKGKEIMEKVDDIMGPFVGGPGLL